MRLNTLKPAAGSKKTKVRLGRGIGSGKGKTCGHGHKGQKARSGYSRKNGFEGGQLPLQRRLPKFGFTSKSAKENLELTLSALEKIGAERLDLQALKAVGVASPLIKKVKVIASGSISKPVTLSGIRVTKEAKQAIEAVGGKIEE